MASCFSQPIEAIWSDQDVDDLLKAFNEKRVNLQDGNLLYELLIYFLVLFLFVHVLVIVYVTLLFLLFILFIL